MVEKYCGRCDNESMVIPVVMNGVKLWRCLHCRALLSEDLKFQVRPNMPMIADPKFIVPQKKPKVYIEDAQPLTKEGIKKICEGVDSPHIKSVTDMTQKRNISDTDKDSSKDVCEKCGIKYNDKTLSCKECAYEKFMPKAKKGCGMKVEMEGEIMGVCGEEDWLCGICKKEKN